MQALTHYELLAELFEYPDRGYPARVRSACDLAVDRYPVAAQALTAFAHALPSDGDTFSEDALDEVQEIFTRSFDVQSITTLGVGYVMFGDDYKRGELLVNLNRELSAVGVDAGNELPDHLPVVLRLLARWQDRDTVVEFVEEILYPALQKMIEEFGPQRMEQRNRLYRKHFKTLITTSAQRGTIYREPLAALRAVLETDFDLTVRERPDHGNDFLRSIRRELDIEASEGHPARSGRML